MSRCTMNREGVIPRLARRYTKRRFGRMVEPRRRRAPFRRAHRDGRSRDGGTAGLEEARSDAAVAGHPSRPRPGSAARGASTTATTRECIEGIDPAKVRSAADWRSSDLFDERERGGPRVRRSGLRLPGRGHRGARGAGAGPPQRRRVRRAGGLGGAGELPFALQCRPGPAQPRVLRLVRDPDEGHRVDLDCGRRLPDAEADAAVFEEWRSLLFGIAYRMLGSATDAEDVVQDACIRWLRRGDEPVQSVRAYLVTIVTRLCLDQLNSSRAKRVQLCGSVVARAGGGRRPLRRQRRRTRCRWPFSCSWRSSHRSSVPRISSTTSSAIPSTRWPGRWGGLLPPAANSPRGPGSTSRSAVGASTRICATAVS